MNIRYPLRRLLCVIGFHEYRATDFTEEIEDNPPEKGYDTKYEVGYECIVCEDSMWDYLIRSRLMARIDKDIRDGNLTEYVPLDD